MRLAPGRSHIPRGAAAIGQRMQDGCRLMICWLRLRYGLPATPQCQIQRNLRARQCRASFDYLAPGFEHASLGIEYLGQVRFAEFIAAPGQ